MPARESRFSAPSSENDAFSHALAMVVTPLVLGLFGHFVDGRVGTGWVFAAVFATFGVVGAFVSAYYRYEARMARHEEGKPWTRKAAR